jgi:WD40 repeat protein
MSGETLYGRDRELRELLDLLIAERIVLLYSPSGAGKSSLIQASLIPGLEAEGFQVLPIIRFNYEPPAELLQKGGFNRYIFSAIQSLEDALPEKQRLPDEITSQMTLPEYLAQRTKGQDEPDTEVFIFDQFEEILTVDVTDRAAKSTLFSQLGTVFRDRKRWAIFSIREDFVGALSPYLRPIPTRFSNTYRLELLGREAARQAIQQPAKEAGVGFQDEEACTLVDDLRRTRIQHPDGTIEKQLGLFVEPVQLQVVCYRLWEHLPPDAAQITAAHVESLGSVDTALADYYAERVTLIAEETGLSERSIRNWFERQLITEQGLRGQVLMEVDSSGGLDNQAIHLLADAHLVRGEQRGGATWFELTHDRLIEPVQQNNALWMETHLSLLQRQAALWDSQGRPDDLLLKGDVLQEAQRWASDHPAEMTPVDVDFLEDSQKEMKRAEEQAGRRRSRVRLIVRFSALAITLAIIAVFLGTLAYAGKERADRNLETAQTRGTIAATNLEFAQAEGTRASDNLATARAEATRAVAAEAIAATAQAAAEKQAAIAVQEKDRAEAAEDEARSRELAALALTKIEQQPDLACLLSLEALEAADTLQARSAMLGELQLHLSRVTSPINPPPPAQEVSLKDVALSADGMLVAFGGDKGMVKVWHLQHGRFTGMYREAVENDTTINALALTPDGGTLFTGGYDATNEEDGTNEEVGTIKEAGTIRQWDVQSGRELRKFTYTPGPIYTLAVSPDGSTLAFAGKGWNIYLKDADDILDEGKTKEIRSEDSTGVVLSLAWSPDGRHILAGGRDGFLRVYEASSGDVIFSEKAHEGRVNSVAWSPGGRWLASGGVDNIGDKDKTLILWEWEDEFVRSMNLVHHPNDVYGVAFSSDSRTLATGSEDGTLTLYDVDTRRRIDLLRDHSKPITGVAFNAQGTPVLAVSTDQRLNLYKIVPQKPLGRNFDTGKGSLKSLGFLTNQELLMLGSQSGNAAFWQAQIDNKSEDEQLFPLSGMPSAAAISSDGKTLLFGYRDSSIHISETLAEGSYTELENLDLPDKLPGPIYSLAIAPDGDTLAAGLCSDPIVQGQVCENYEIQLWSISSNALLDTLGPITEKATSLAFNPTGQRLAAGTQDQMITFWTREDGGSYELDPESPYQSGSGISSLAFDPEGKLLAAGTTLGDVLLLDVDTLSPYGEKFIGASGPVTALAFSPDTKVLASGSETGDVIFWDLDVEHWVERACALAGRNLSQEEWEKYVKLDDYQATCPQ